MTQERVFGLDFLRALAIVLVLIAHASFVFIPLSIHLEPWWMLGHLGVELFFVLSGFLIGGILAEQASSPHFSVAGFWKRRWMRTLPNYYLFLILNIFIARQIDGVWPDAGRYAVFMQNFLWAQPIFFIESWSLSVEELFYLAAPIMILLFPRRAAARIGAPALMMMGIAALTCVRIAYVLITDPKWDLSLRMVSAVRLDAIAYGALAMLLCRRRKGASPRTAQVIAVGGAFGLAAAIWLYLTVSKDTNLFARTGLFSLISASFAAFLPAAATWRRSRLTPFAERSIRAIARWSYALYLCQLAVMRVLFGIALPRASSAWGCVAQAVLFMTASIACAALVYYAFEAPILRLRDRWTRPEPSPTKSLRGT